MIRKRKPVKLVLARDVPINGHFALLHESGEGYYRLSRDGIGPDSIFGSGDEVIGFSPDDFVLVPLDYPVALLPEAK